MVLGRIQVRSSLVFALAQGAMRRGYSLLVFVQQARSVEEELRRFLAIALLAVFGLPFVSPLLAMTARSEANLPACCRKHGKHHCMMSVVERNQLDGGEPAFTAPLEKCPYAPAAILSTHHPTKLASPSWQMFYAKFGTGCSGIGPTIPQVRLARDKAHGKRGPPLSPIL